MTNAITILFKDGVTVPTAPGILSEEHHARNQATYEVVQYHIASGGVVRLHFPNSKLVIERDNIVSYYEP